MGNVAPLFLGVPAEALKEPEYVLTKQERHTGESGTDDLKQKQARSGIDISIRGLPRGNEYHEKPANDTARIEGAPKQRELLDVP
jgi:hypothetical protein